MTLRYTFNLDGGRFDTYAMNLFNDRGATRLTRDRVISDVREGKLDHLLLRSMKGLEDIPVEISDRAAINVIDFHFEPLVLRNMGAPQLAAYCKNLEKTLHMESVCAIDTAAPLWVSSVHHTCVFSSVAQLSIHLVNQFGYRKLLVLHQGNRPEPRLALMANAVEHECKVRPFFVQLTGNWFGTLSKLTSPETVIFYFVDMPHAISNSRVQKEYRRASVELLAMPGKAIQVETLSGADTFARRLGAGHVVLDYPELNRVRLRPYSPANPVSSCPLEDWAFWPLLKPIENGEAVAVPITRARQEPAPSYHENAFA